MKRFWTVLLLAALLLPASALALTGQTYDAFSANYTDNVTFINDNDNRHLMPLVLSQRTGDDGSLYYELFGDVLNVTVNTDLSGVIKSCLVMLNAPANMEYGTATYNDFAISGYHSYAFLMAMDTSAEPADRYALVTDVVQGMAASADGTYTRQLGVYTLTCNRVDQTAILDFVNNGVPVETPTPDPNAPTPDPASETPLPDTADDYIG